MQVQSKASNQEQSAQGIHTNVYEACQGSGSGHEEKEEMSHPEDEDFEDDYDFDQDELMFPMYDEDGEYLIDGVGFADPGGRSALRAETEDNSRNLPCPTCGRQNMLTPLDKARNYQCNFCADAAEGY